jgi:hypothetical protein
VPLSRIQTEILRLLAAHRDPESYVAGAAPLNRAAPRISGDIDLFHDREERVAAAALEDTQTLAAAGYGVVWLRQLPLMYTAEVTQGDASTRLEWVADSDYRFFPTMRDETFGYVLHPFEPDARHAARGGSPEIVVHRVDLGPAKRHEPIPHGILQRLALAVVQNLVGRRLPHIAIWHAKRFCGAA